MIDPYEYPINYDFLTSRQKHNIIKAFTTSFAQAEFWYARIDKNKFTSNESYSYCVEMYNHYISRNDNYYDALALAGIYVEYGWVGHRNEFFLATQNDAFLQEEWMYAASE